MPSSTYDAVATVLTTTLGRPAASVGPDTVLDDLYLDSLALVELSVSLSEQLGVQVTGVDRGQTLAELSVQLDRMIASNRV